jgi:hypothetical protein
VQKPCLTPSAKQPPKPTQFRFRVGSGCTSRSLTNNSSISEKQGYSPQTSFVTAGTLSLTCSESHSPFGNCCFSGEMQVQQPLRRQTEGPVQYVSSRPGKRALRVRTQFWNSVPTGFHVKLVELRCATLHTSLCIHMGPQWSSGVKSITILCAASFMKLQSGFLSKPSNSVSAMYAALRTTNGCDNLSTVGWSEINDPGVWVGALYQGGHWADG